MKLSKRVYVVEKHIVENNHVQEFIRQKEANGFKLVNTTIHDENNKQVEIEKRNM